MPGIGIPYRLVHHTDGGDLLDKTIILASRSADPAHSAKLRTALREYAHAQRDMGNATRAHNQLARRIAELSAEHPLHATLGPEREAAFDRIAEAGTAAIAAAETVALLSLQVNYGEQKAGEIFAHFSNRDLHGIAQTLQLGEQPEDFFPRRATPAKPTSTSRPGDSQPGSSSTEDSPLPTSPAER